MATLTRCAVFADNDLLAAWVRLLAMIEQRQQGGELVLSKGELMTLTGKYRTDRAQGLFVELAGKVGFRVDVREDDTLSVSVAEVLRIARL